MRPVILVVIDTDKKYLSPVVLQYIGVFPVENLSDCTFCRFVPLELDDQCRLLSLLKRKIDDVGIAVTRRKLLELQVVVAVGIVGKFDDASETCFTVVIEGEPSPLCESSRSVLPPLLHSLQECL